MKISVVIPTLNESAQIAAAIQRTRLLGPCEIIVVDGGSTDDTMLQSRAADVVIASRRGRALQLNSGAQAATGDVLLFLHADCWLEPHALGSIRQALASRETAAGCFAQHIEAPGARFRVLEWGNGLRVRALGWAYGDQALFVRRKVFEDLGGFPELSLMEDLYFSKRLKAASRVHYINSCRVHISARRWQRFGVIRQTLRNWCLVTMAQCGVSPNRLARFYSNTR